MTKLNSKNIYQLIKIRFADYWQKVKEITWLNPKDLNNNRKLACTLLILFAFYAHILQQNANETHLYTGPVSHRKHTILVQDTKSIYQLYTMHDFQINNQHLTNQKSKLLRQCLSYLNQIGCSRDYAQRIFSN